MRRFAKVAAVIVAGLLVAIQAVRPARTNPAVDEGRTIQARTQMPPDIAALLERACNDCHSNKTIWPWYSQVAPTSWLLVHDVNEGRREFSLSNWAGYTPQRAARKLRRMCEQVEKGKMPPADYLLMHAAARLSAQDREALCQWTRAEQGRLAAGQAPR